MKYLILLTLFCPFALLGQNQPHVICCFPRQPINIEAQLSTALSRADLDGVTRFLSEEKVYISTYSQQRNYTKAQAKYVIKELLTNSPPQKVEVYFQEKKADEEVIFYHYISTRGKYDLRITLQQFHITEMCFELDN